MSCSVQFSSVSRVSLLANPWTLACQASLSITNSWSLLKLMSMESVMPSNHLILCRPLLLLPSSFPASGSFSMSQFFASGGQSIEASASVLPTNIPCWFPLGWTGLILLSKGLSRVFPGTMVWKKFSGRQLIVNYSDTFKLLLTLTSSNSELCLLNSVTPLSSI